jgi:hypothetical protein
VASRLSPFPLYKFLLEFDYLVSADGKSPATDVNLDEEEEDDDEDISFVKKIR